MHHNFVTVLYVTESCGFQQNVQKEIVYTTKASVWAGKWTIWKEY